VVRGCISILITLNFTVVRDPGRRYPVLAEQGTKQPADIPGLAAMIPMALQGITKLSGCSFFLWSRLHRLSWQKLLPGTLVYTPSEDIFLLSITSHTPAPDKETILGVHIYIPE
jgi:hypothetical protein